MTTIAAIRTLLAAFIGMWIYAVWSAWRAPTKRREGREYYAGMLTMWLVFVLLVLAASYVWSVVQS